MLSLSSKNKQILYSMNASNKLNMIRLNMSEKLLPTTLICINKFMGNNKKKRRHLQWKEKQPVKLALVRVQTSEKQ